MSFKFLDLLENYENKKVDNVKKLVEEKNKKIDKVLKEAFDGDFVGKAEAILNVDGFLKEAPKGVETSFIKENYNKIVDKINTLTEGEIKIIVNNYETGSKGSSPSVSYSDDFDESAPVKKGKRGRPKKEVQEIQELAKKNAEVVEENVEEDNEEDFKEAVSTDANKLTPEQKEEIKKELVDNGTPVRFIKDGKNLNITTGELLPKGTNVIYHNVYWKFSKDTAKKIAKWLNCRAEFSSDVKEESEEIDEATQEPNDKDCFITKTETGSFVVDCGGKYIGNFKSFDIALDKIEKWQEKKGKTPIWSADAGDEKYTLVTPIEESDEEVSNDEEDEVEEACATKSLKWEDVENLVSKEEISESDDEDEDDEIEEASDELDLGTEDDYVEELPSDEDEKIITEPDPDDCYISPTGRLGSQYQVSCEGKVIAKVTEFDDALKAIRDWQDKNQYYPNIWIEDDHGGYTLIDNEGNHINEEVEDKEDSNIEKYEFKMPTYLVPVLVNGDGDDDFTEEDNEALEDVNNTAKELAAKHNSDNYHWSFGEEEYFSNRPDFGKVGSDVVDATLVIFKNDKNVEESIEDDENEDDQDDYDFSYQPSLSKWLES